MLILWKVRCNRCNIREAERKTENCTIILRGIKYEWLCQTNERSASWIHLSSECYKSLAMVVEYLQLLFINLGSFFFFHLSSNLRSSFTDDEPADIQFMFLLSSSNTSGRWVACKVSSSTHFKLRSLFVFDRLVVFSSTRRFTYPPAFSQGKRNWLVDENGVLMAKMTTRSHANTSLRGRR